ncbi:MAG: S28 family serine protease, partial [Bdellovibrionota bacterium]
MKNSLSSGLVLFSLLISVAAHADPKSIRYERYLQKQEEAFSAAIGQDLSALFSEGSPFGKPDAAPAAKAGTFAQRLNHADASDARTFDQRYYVDSTYATDSNSPVLYYICGEAACDAPVFHGAILNYAKQFHAHMAALEHRYYGKSQPFADLSAEHLKYLTTENALEDLAAFQTFASVQFQLAGKWISIGGSYPGALSAFYRQKYPTLVVGALASSGPVQAKANFEEYDLDVNDVAGPDCAASIRKVVAQVEAAIANNPDEFLRIKKLFNADMIRDPVDFLYVIADMAATAIQYGHRDEFCQEMASGDDAVLAYSIAGKKMFDLFGETAEQDSVQYIETDDLARNQDSIGMRQWTYQTCREYGYFQVAYHDPARATRSAKIDLKYNMDVCTKLFGLPPVDTDALVRV